MNLLTGNSPSDLLNRYLHYRTAEYGFDAAKSAYFPSIDEQLSRKDRTLSIMQKKRELGLPVSSSNYDKFRNKEEDTFFSHAVRQGSKTGLNALGPRHMPFSKTPNTLFDVAKGVSSGLLSLGKSIPNRRGLYARLIGSIVR